MRLRGPRRDPHDWASWTAYCGAHDGKIEDYDHFIVEDRLTREVGTDLVQWRGAVTCADGYEINVRRAQVVDIRGGVPWVKTTFYAYHALRRRDDQVVNLFRYDNIHPHPDHPSPHHRHRYHLGIEIKPVEHVGESGWPNLGQVLDEIYELWLRRI